MELPRVLQELGQEKGPRIRRGSSRGQQGQRRGDLGRCRHCAGVATALWERWKGPSLLEG